MPEVRIKHRAFTYYREVEDPVDPNNTTKVSAIATRGQSVEVSDADFKRGSLSGAFVDESGEDAGSDLSATKAVDLSDDELDELLEEQSPNVKETIALANGDPESAQRVLDAEERVTGGEPRQGVEDGLTKIIEG
jgi:hypothetical protein